MSNHAWCRDVARDAAVRAAEDGRTAPLPTLEQCIERQKQTARPCGGTDPAPSRGERGAADTGMRTERVTLEVTHGNPWRITAWEWSYILRLGTGESVRVVDTHAEAVAESVAWEGARDAYRGRILRLTDERDKLRVRVADLEAASGGGVSSSPPISGDGKSSVEETQAASGGGEGEPAQWAVLYPTGRLGSSFDTKDQADSLARNQSLYELTVVPLYRQPPQPRGWLTQHEIAALTGCCVSSGNLNEEGKKTIRSLLSRSSPPEVVLTEAFNRFDTYGDRVASFDAHHVRRVLAAAGVAVKEVG